MAKECKWCKWQSYESPFACNRKMDKLVSVNSVTTNEVEEPNSSTCLEVMMVEVMMDFEQTTSPNTPRSKTSFIYEN